MSSTVSYSVRYLKLLVILPTLVCLRSHAQEVPNKPLDEVKVLGFSTEHFMAGLKVQKVDSTTLAKFQYQTLADFLQFQSPVAFKSYGTGQLSTIALWA